MPGTDRQAEWPAVVTSGVLVAAAVVTGLVAVPGAVARSYEYTAQSADPGALIRTYVPSGSCVVTDVTTVLVVADRFDASRACDVPLDAYGTWLALNDRRSPHATEPYEPDFVERWAEWLREADFVVLTVQQSNFVPWTPELLSWFASHYVLVGSGPWTFVYFRLPTT